MATHSSVFAWRILRMAKPGGLPSVGSHRVGHDWSDLAAAAAMLEGLVGLYRTVSFSFFSLTGWSIDLDYCDTEWVTLEMNRDHSIVFETAPKNCISDSFVDYEGYFISSKGFLPTVEHIMVIWVKFTIPVHFSHQFLKCQHSLLHLLFDHFQFTLIHGPNFPGCYTILFFRE